MSYDSKCYELAEWFLHDSNLSIRRYAPRLAQIIQDAIENEIGDWVRESDEQANDPHEQVAARARANDFYDTNGKDWT